ncbi:hypothetical protein J7K91_02380, partial [bacterium]|nr:hypothetical protein [bacterium]
FKVPFPEILLILKINTYFERKGTIKGEKDLLDIFSLISQEKIDWERYQQLIKKYHLEKTNQKLKQILLSVKTLPELNLLNHQISRLKRKILSLIF